MIRKSLSIGIGLAALALLAAAPAQALVQTVNVGGLMNVFSPKDVTISQGDSIKWVWVSGTHTTTSGDPSTCTADGMWNAPIDGGHTSFTLQFNTQGTFKYFCTFHCFMGMNGSVTVQQRSAGVPDAQLSALRAGALWSSPNPFHATTAISFQLAEGQSVVLEIYDAGGQRVATLANGGFESGVHTVTWDGRNENGSPAPSGIYFARSRTAHSIATVPLVLVR